MTLLDNEEDPKTAERSFITLDRINQACNEKLFIRDPGPRCEPHVRAEELEEKHGEGSENVPLSRVLERSSRRVGLCQNGSAERARRSTESQA